jgi:hypothetical protein
MHNRLKDLVKQQERDTLFIFGKIGLEGGDKIVQHQFTGKKIPGSYIPGNSLGHSPANEEGLKPVQKLPVYRFRQSVQRRSLMYGLNDRPFTQGRKKLVKTEGVQEKRTNAANTKRRDFLKGEFKKGARGGDMKLRVPFIKIAEFRQSRLTSLYFVQKKQGFAGNNRGMVVECQLGAYLPGGKDALKEAASFFVFVKVDFDNMLESLA